MKWAVVLVGLVLFAAVSGGSSATLIPDAAADIRIEGGDIPPDMAAIYIAVAEKYNLDWAVLAAVGKVESGHCANRNVSSAGAQGCMQFMPATWAAYGKGGDPWDPEDSIDTAARYLKANGAPADYQRALFAYNHAQWYVDKVLAQADTYRDLAVVQTPIISGPLRQRIVEVAKSTLTKRTGYFYYSKPGVMTDNLMPVPGQRSDCSQWVRAVYLAAGAPDPGFSTWDQAPNGSPTTEPQPGDLMFAGDLGHVEIYIGNGRTIGHGDEYIDYARVEYWSSHFFRSYL